MLVALVPAVQDNLAGPVTQMAYEALRLNLYQDRDNVSQPMLQTVVPQTHELLRARLALYKDGFPDTPVVDTLATSFLIDAQVLACRNRAGEDDNGAVDRRYADVCVPAGRSDDGSSRWPGQG